MHTIDSTLMQLLKYRLLSCERTAIDCIPHYMGNPADRCGTLFAIRSCFTSLIGTSRL